MSRTGGESELNEARYVLRGELHSQGSPKRINAETSEILVEVSAARRQGDRLDPVRASPCAQAFHCMISGGIVVANDVKAAQCGRKENGCEVSG